MATTVGTSHAFGGIVLDATARGVMLSDRGKYTNFVLVMGILGILTGVVFYTSGGSDREVSGYFFAGGGVVALCGFVARQILRRLEASRLNQPRTLQGVVVSQGGLTWGTCSARFGEIRHDSMAITEWSPRVPSAPDARPATMTILVAPLEGTYGYHIKRLSLDVGDDLKGEVTTDESGVFYAITGPALHATALPLACDAEQHNVSPTCVRNLRQIGEAVSARQDLTVRLAIAYPKEGVMKWGLLLGMIGGLIATGLEAASRDKLQKLLDEGGLRDSGGSLLELVEQRGWQLELV